MALSDSIIRELRTYFLSLDRKNVINGDIKPATDDTLRLGSPSKKFHAIYATRIVTDNLEGDGASGVGGGGNADTLGEDALTAHELATIGELYPLSDDGLGNAIFPSGVLPADIVYEDSTPTFTSINVTNYVDGIDVGSHDHSGSANMGSLINHADLSNLSADHHTIYTRWDDTETVIKKWKFSNLADDNQDFNEYVGWEIEASVVLNDITGTYYPDMNTAQAVFQTLSFSDPTYPTYEHAYPLQIIAHAQYAAITLGGSDEILIKTNSSDTWIDVGNIELSNTNGITIGSTFEVTQAGVMTATSGYVGTWQILDDKLQSDTEEIILDSNGYVFLMGTDTELRMSSIHSDYMLWVGNDGETVWDETTAKFIVNPLGEVTTETLALKGLLHNYGTPKWKITSDGYAEFESIKARGRLETLVFSRSTVSSIAGVLALSKGAVLAEAIDDTQTYIYLDDIEFSFGSILLLQTGADSREYLLVVSGYTETTIQNEDGESVTAYKYTVARDFGDYGSSYAYDRGVAVNGRGSYAAGNDPLPLASGDVDGAFGAYQPSGTFSGAGGGWITLDGENAFIEVNVRTGPLPEQYQSFIRIGNLQGMLTYTDIDYGFAIGDENNYFTYDQTTGLTLYSRDGVTTIGTDGIQSDAFIISLETVETATADTDTVVLYYYGGLIKYRMDATGSETTGSLATQEWTVSNYVNYTTPEIGGDIDGQGSYGIADIDYIDIDQSADAVGITVYGFDDMSAEFLKLYIDDSGYAEIEADAKLSLISGSTADILIHSANDIILELGDAGGADSVKINDSASSRVFAVDSNGIVIMRRTIEIVLLDNNTTLTTGDDFPVFYWIVPEELDGYDIVDVDFAVSTASTSGLPSFAMYNVTDSVDILSVNCTIDANEATSYTATTGPTINTANDDLDTGDQIRFDCDTAGTGTKGCTVILVVSKP